MMARSYSLAEYRIIEHDSGVLWWESHAGLGGIIGGRCFVRGDILFIGPGESEEAGFLKREFLEALRRLPQWEKTRYYCPRFEIYLSQSGRKLSRGEMVKWSAGRIHMPEKKNSSLTPSEREDYAKSPDAMEDVSYRLGRYEIIRKRNGQVVWKMPRGRSGLRGGNCTVVEDILFIRMDATEESNALTHGFPKDLSKLPEWRDTAYYCPGCALYDCVTGKRRVREGGGWGPDERSRRRRHEAGDTDKTVQETRTWMSDLKEWGAGIPLYGLKKQIVHVAAFLLGMGARLLAVILTHWTDKGGDHKRRDH